MSAYMIILTVFLIQIVCTLTSFPSTIIGVFERFRRAICKTALFSVKLILSPANIAALISSTFLSFAYNKVNLQYISFSRIMFQVAHRTSHIKTKQETHGHKRQRMAATLLVPSEKEKKFVSVFYAINIFYTIYYFKPTNFNCA